MKNLATTLFLAGGLAIFGCGQKDNITNVAPKQETNNLKESLSQKDSIVLENNLSIKFTDKGFRQYNEKGLLVREIEEDEDKTFWHYKTITDYIYNDKNQKVKMVDSYFNYNEKEDKDSLIEKDSTMYEYNEKGQLAKEISLSPYLMDESNPLPLTCLYEYNKKGELTAEKRKYGDGKKVGWLETLQYEYNNQGKLIKTKWINGDGIGGISYYLDPNDSTSISAHDHNSDGKIDYASL